MPKRTVVALAFSLGLVAIPQAAGASVATSCSFDAGTATVTAVIGTGDHPTLIRNADGIEFGGLACGAATVTTTDLIVVQDPDPSSGESLTVSLAGGRLVPGKTPEDDGTDEIEIGIDNAYPGGLTLIGTDVSDHFLVRASYVDLNTNVSFDPEITMPITTGTTGVDGGKGNDVIQTKAYQASVTGGEGDDVIYPTDAAPSTYDGGPGDDELSYAYQVAPYGISDIHALGGGDASILRGGVSPDVAHGFETFGAFDAPTKFFGSGDADHFIGGKYNDLFLPLGGDDVVDGGPPHPLTGPFDVDTFSTGASAAPTVINLDNGTAVGEGTDTFRHMEVVQGSPQDDIFSGSTSDSDVLEVDGYGGHDVLDLSGADWPQRVYVGPNVPVGWLWAIGIAKVIGSGHDDVFTVSSGDAPVEFHGRGGDDTLVGGPAADLIGGGAGDDTLRGKGGPDTLDGKGGTDTCVGGPGKDAILRCEAS